MRYVLISAAVGLMLFACNDQKTEQTTLERKDSLLNVEKAKESEAISEHKQSAISAHQIDQIIDNLSALQLVKSADRLIDSASMGSRHISFMPDSVASTGNLLYIGVGDNRPDRFETFINFYVNTKTHEIRVYDVVHDDTVSVKEYEARQKISTE